MGNPIPSQNEKKFLPGRWSCRPYSRELELKYDVFVITVEKFHARKAKYISVALAYRVEGKTIISIVGSHRKFSAAEQLPQHTNSVFVFVGSYLIADQPFMGSEVPTHSFQKYSWFGHISLGRLS